MTPQIDLSMNAEPLLTQLKQQGLEPIDAKAENILFEIDNSKWYVDRLFRATLITFGEHTNIIKRMHRKITKLVKPIEKK